MGRPKKFENGFQVVKVYLQPKEFERIGLVCGGNMSEWVRQAVLAELNGIPLVMGEYKETSNAYRVDQPVERKPEKGRSVARRRGGGDVLPKAGNPKFCQHGINEGGTCTKCPNGKAVADV